MTRLVICVLLCVASSALGRHEKYEGHQLYRVSGLDEQIRALEASLDILSAKPAARSSSGNLEAVVRLSPEEKQQWLQYFDERNMLYTKIADNLADIFRAEEAQINATKRSGKSFVWNTYYRHDEINDYLDHLAAKNPDLVTVINAGLSYEGRQIKYVRISTTRFENTMKPVIVLDAMTHAREWVTTSVALYIIDQLVNQGQNSVLVNEIDWLIIPVVNPDGYEYSFDEDRLWRKTRSKAHEGADECPGVDVNRNFDHHFGTNEHSANPCSNTYEGLFVFSEPETRIVQSAVLSNIDRTALYISLHSFSSMFLYSWGNGTLPSNGLILHLVGVQMATVIDEIALDKADRYIVGNAANALYPTTGTSRDWARAAGVPLTYTLLLPGYEYQFEVPPKYIEQIVTETWPGIAVGAQYVRNNW
ncbi:hypothetical protein PYW07_007802 [Mythimna separata]|uniref:Peptidase M14 domain-containing protein n=1 Tax=Mythimna separata TaxID=271217 RepID=A0AAD7YQ43_MYTSE|nr:hypothetical protein PYW07_007802 [Mythimna separata]